MALTALPPLHDNSVQPTSVNCDRGRIVPEPLEIIFYIHGVSPNREARLHTDEYAALHQGIAHVGVAGGWPSVFGGAEWGANLPVEARPNSHKALTDAQNQLGDLVIDRLQDQRDLTFNPTRVIINGLRSLMFYGFGDVFYYVSAGGKWAVRHEVAGQLLEHISARRTSDDQPVSLTLLGHSAGSVVAFDFLYYLFSSRTHRFLESGGDDTSRGMEALRELAKNRQIRLRRLYTFGSPISLVAFRSNALVEIFARGDKLLPSDYGLTSTLAQDDALHGPRWINIWDKDDPIAWPIAPIMDSPLAEDVYVDVSDSIGKAHNAYWESSRVHHEIAAKW